MLLKPPQEHEHGLYVLLKSFSTVLDTARTSIIEGKANNFALQRVNSFFYHRGWRFPLLYQMQEKTYRYYAHVWQKLLTFVYRSAVLGEGPRRSRLPVRLTAKQQAALDQLTELEEEERQAIDAMDTDAFDTEALDTEALDTEAMDTEAMDTEAMDTEAMDTEAVDSDVMNAKAVDSEAIAVEATAEDPGKQACLEGGLARLF
jgi:hypothetical protein